MGNLRTITQKSKVEARQKTSFFLLLFELCLWYWILYLKNAKILFHGDPFGPFWSAKYLKFGAKSCEIKILSPLIQETYTLHKVKKTSFTFSIKLRIIFVWSHGLYLFSVYLNFCLYFLVLQEKGLIRKIRLISNFMIPQPV